jgi:hypothetical protein
MRIGVGWGSGMGWSDSGEESEAAENNKKIEKMLKSMDKRGTIVLGY